MHLGQKCIDIRKSNLISQPLMKLQTNRPLVMIQGTVVSEQVCFTNPRVFAERRLGADADGRRVLRTIGQPCVTSINAI